MKKIVLAALNAKYFHTNLAVRCLKAHAGENYDIEIVERTINDNLDDVLEDIVIQKPHAAGFSCYIWNIEHIIRLASNLKKVLPECFIFMGGPEASYECKEFLDENQFVDMVIKGEGETTFGKWIKAFEAGESFETLSGTTVRTNAGIKDNSDKREAFDLNSLPFLYDDLTEYENKIIYFETSRGCPMRCAYCMSGNSGELSYMGLDNVKRAFSYFIENDVRQIKLVDRTFNYPISRAKEILKMLIDAKKSYPHSGTNFHFEITASMIDDEFIEIVKSAPEGLFQFEAGVQSTSRKTLKAVSRSVDSEKLLSNLKKIANTDNATVYADLIAGLPYENYESFKSSFNAVYNTGAQKIHLGFLKVLKGSKIKALAANYGIEYSDKAPYKVLKTGDISYLELRRLEKMEHIVDRYKNSENFSNSLEYAVKVYKVPFDFFESFSGFAERKGFFKSKQSILNQFDLLYDFMADSEKCDLIKLKDSLMCDWALMEKPRRYPKCILKKNSDSEKQLI